MKVLFVHDHRFYEENGQYYSTKFSPKTWQPYLQGGNEVLMYARKTEKNVCNYVLQKTYRSTSLNIIHLLLALSKLLLD